MREEELILEMEGSVVTRSDVENVFPHMTLKGAIKRLEFRTGRRIYRGQAEASTHVISFDQSAIQRYREKLLRPVMAERHFAILETLKAPTSSAEIRRKYGEPGAQTMYRMIDLGMIVKASELDKKGRNTYRSVYE